jgi:hypothetical protein
LRSAPIPSALVERVVGTKKNNDVPPGPTNLGTLPGVATVADPTYVEGKQVALSTDLAGNLRVTTSGSDVVTANQGLKTAVPNNAWPVTLFDGEGTFKARVTRQGWQMTADPMTFFRQQFSQPTFDSNNQQQLINTTGVVTMPGVTQKLTSGVGAAGAATVASLRSFGSFPGYITEWAQTLQASANAANNVRTWGLFSGTPVAIESNALLANGYGFQMDGTAGTFKAIVLKAGAVTQSIDLTALGYDPTNWHVYGIQFAGVVSAEFFVDGVGVGAFSITNAAALLADAGNFFSTLETHNTAAQAAGRTLESTGLYMVVGGATDQLNNSLAFSAIGTTVVKVGPGIVNALNIMTSGNGANTVNIYDNTAASGRLLYTIPGGEAPRLPDMDLPFAIGLTVQSVGGVAAVGTVEYV